MASYLWRKYSEYLYTKWERTILWDMIEPYRRPKSFTPLEKCWEEYPGEVVPLMKPQFYGGPWRIMRGEVPPTG
ncbi:hypothetical protein QN277_010538 [Acacia crassicarpa]|uniref:Uncharacterized protein n=1 Tax=Acacia crassicarpa TaxID=499986 RepID=A0AAE1IPV7_9FABA|nr:hypothetical protein QN277_010538 [Acacia crassicarpa]